MACEDYPCCGHEAGDCEGQLYGSSEAIVASVHRAWNEGHGYCDHAEGLFNCEYDEDEDEDNADDEDTRAVCLDYYSDKGDCKGPVEMRESLSGTGTPIARCDKHYDRAVRRTERTNRRYGVNSHVPPAWFDPAYAGEHWDEDY